MKRLLVIVLILSLMSSIIWAGITSFNDLPQLVMRAPHTITQWAQNLTLPTRIPQLGDIRTWFSKSRHQDTQANLPQVRIELVPEVAATHQVRLKGVVKPIEYPALLSPHAATVSRVYVQNGQFVAKGKPVLRLDDKALRNRYMQLQSQFGIAQAEAQMGAASDLFNGEDSEYNESSSVEMITGESRRVIQRQHMRDSGMIEGDQALAESQPNPSDKLSVLRAELNKVKAQLAAQTITMPQSGKVIDLVEPHDTVTVNQVLAHIDKPLPPTIQVAIPIHLLPQLSPKQSVLVRLPQSERLQTIPAKFTSLPSKPGTTPGPAQALVQTQQTFNGPSLKGGDLVDVLCELPGAGSIFIPNSAIQQRSNYAVVYVYSPQSGFNRVLERAVMIGKRTSTQTEIVEGLTPGEQIVVYSTEPLQHNQVVKLARKRMDDDDGP